MAERIDKKYLAGLKFAGSKPVKIDGAIKHQPFTRELKPDDVLSWRDDGNAVVIVTADGQKHRVKK